jgi:hypothetical protein
MPPPEELDPKVLLLLRVLLLSVASPENVNIPPPPELPPEVLLLLTVLLVSTTELA